MSFSFVKSFELNQMLRVVTLYDQYYHIFFIPFALVYFDEVLYSMNFYKLQLFTTLYQLNLYHAYSEI